MKRCRFNSEEAADLAAALDHARFFSTNYNLEIQIVGTTITDGKSVIAELNNDEHVLLLWQEYIYQQQEVR